MSGSVRSIKKSSYRGYDSHRPKVRTIVFENQKEYTDWLRQDSTVFIHAVNEDDNTLIVQYSHN